MGRNQGTSVSWKLEWRRMMMGGSLASVSEVILMSTNWSAHGVALCSFKTVARQRSRGEGAFVLIMQSRAPNKPSHGRFKPARIFRGLKAQSTVGESTAEIRE
jgi:hypothetical protein